jgi:hypothetical protein
VRLLLIKKQTKLENRGKAMFSMFDIRAEKTFTYCSTNTCLDAKINPNIGLGAGIEAGIGYESYKNQLGGSATLLFSLGAGAMMGMELNLRAYPNPDSADDNSIDSNLIFADKRIPRHKI